MAVVTVQAILAIAAITATLAIQGRRRDFL